MKRILVIGVGLALLGGCGGSPKSVSANSADSVVTTAEGNVVATIPTATPTPDAADNAAVTDGAETMGNDAAP